MSTRILLATALIFGAISVMARAQEAAPASPSTVSGQSSEPQANSSAKKKEAEEGTEAFTKSPAVVAIGKKMGLNPETASSTFFWINFAILAAAILYALGKALPKTFRGRTETIQKGIVEARSATEEANNRLSGVEARLARLDSEIADLKAQSEKDAAADEVRIKAVVEDEKQRIVQSAEQEIHAAQAQAERSLREFAASLAVQQAASQLQITPEQDSELVREFAGRLAKENHN